MECGCKVEMDLDAPRRAVNNGAAVRIIYCPKHAEVDDMLAALEKAAPILARLVIEKALEPSMLGYYAAGWTAKEAVVAAIAAARGGAA